MKIADCLICCVIFFIPFSHGMENISPGEVKRSEDLAIPDVEKLIDSDLVGRIPLCTYVIEDGQTSTSSNSEISGNVSSPIIHPEFGCVSCKLELQKACHTSPSEIRCEDDIPETKRKLRDKLDRTRKKINREPIEPVYKPNLGVRTCNPCPPIPRESVSTASDTINCRYEDDGKESDYDQSASENVKSKIDIDEAVRPKRKVQFETKCREFTPTCGGTDSVNFQKDCQPKIVCYKKPKIVSRRRRDADADPKIRKLCRKRLVVKKRKNQVKCNCATPSKTIRRTSRQVDSPFGPLKFVNPIQGSRRTFRQTHGHPTAVTQRRVCRMVAGEKEVCKIQQVQVCHKLPETACEKNFGVQLALRCNEAIDIPLIHLVE